MSTKSEQVIDVTSTARSALDKSAELWKQGEQRFSDQVDTFARLPEFDADRAVRVYFDYLQRGLEVNRELAQNWVDSVNSLSEISRQQLSALGSATRGHAEAITDWVTGEADTVAQTAQAQLEYTERAREEKAREQYAGLSKTELTELAAERDLPKTGTVEELVDRLVAADAR
jgi:hypothetical protein